MKHVLTILLLTFLACVTDTGNVENGLRADYDEEAGLLVIAGQSNWDGLADIWIDQGGELVNHGPLYLEDSVQVLSSDWDPSWQVFVQERVTEEWRDIALVGADERLAASSITDPEDFWSSETVVEKSGAGGARAGGRAGTHCYYIVGPYYGQICRASISCNGAQRIVACWPRPDNRYR